MGNDRKNNDTRLVKMVMKEIKLDEEDINITNVIRLGRFDKENHNPRLVKVTFDNEDLVHKVLRHAKNLKEVTNEGIKRIKIFRDLSVTELEARRYLVNEMKKRNEEIAQNSSSCVSFKWIIRGDQLVKVKLGEASGF